MNHKFKEFGTQGEGSTPKKTIFKGFLGFSMYITKGRGL